MLSSSLVSIIFRSGTCCCHLLVDVMDARLAKRDAQRYYILPTHQRDKIATYVMLLGLATNDTHLEKTVDVSGGHCCQRRVRTVFDSQTKMEQVQAEDTRALTITVR